MRNSPSKGQVAKKWAVNSVDGPLVNFAELVLKKLLAHKIPCDYSLLGDGRIVFVPKRYHRPLGRDFSLFLSTAVRIVNSDRKVLGFYEEQPELGHLVGLLCPHYIDERGQLKKG